jgi:hypothetical protein
MQSSDSLLRQNSASEFEWLEQEGWLAGRNAIEVLETWITRLAAAAAGDIAPKRFLALTVDQEFTVGDNPQVVAPTEGVLWVEQLSGSSKFLSTCNGKDCSSSTTISVHA